MPLKMDLFGNNYIKHLSNKTFVVLFLLICIVFNNCRQASSVNPSSLNNAKGNELLVFADSLMNHKPNEALLLSKKALLRAEKNKDSLEQTKAFISLGKINVIIGERNLSQYYFEKALKLALRKKYNNEICEAAICFGEGVYKQGNYPQSLVYFKMADSLAIANALHAWHAQSIYHIGKYYQTTGKFYEANTHYQRALNIARNQNNSKLISLILPSLGKYYLSDNKLHLALRCYLEAFYVSQKLEDPLLKADVCNHLGGLYLQINQPAKALLFHQKALSYRTELKNLEGLAKSYNNIGRAFFALKNNDSALYYFEKSLLLCKQVSYKKGAIKSEINIGDVLLSQSLYSEAFPYLKLALAESQSTGYETGISETCLALGDYYQKIGKIDSAMIYYKQALNILIHANYEELLVRNYSGLYRCYKSKLDFKNALITHEALLASEKRLLNLENNRQLTLLNSSFEAERKEKDFQVLVKDNILKETLLKNKTNILWLSIVVLCFFILLCLYLYNQIYVKKKANQQLKNLNQYISEQNKELEKLNVELEYANKEKDKLFAIISHELRNPLYWLQNLAEVLNRRYHSLSAEKIKKTLRSLDESSKNVYHLMDNLLFWARFKLNRIYPKKVNANLNTVLNDTIAMYSSFIDDKEIILLNNVDEHFIIFADIDLLCCVIRNLLSNAIKYTPQEGKIIFTSEQTNHAVTICVSDSGKGMDTFQLQNLFEIENNSISNPGLMQEKGSGLGLKLCKDFVELNSGTIWVSSKLNEGTSFYFTVPLSQEQNKVLEKQLLNESSF